MFDVPLSHLHFCDFCISIDLFQVAAADEIPNNGQKVSVPQERDRDIS